MRLWLLDRAVPNGAPLYDCAHGFVIRAEDEIAARRLADGFAGDEGPRWTDPTFARCAEVTMDGPTAMILRDFNAG